MNKNEGLPFVKFMMLLSSLAPLLILLGIRGMDEILCYKKLWLIIFLLLAIPFLVLLLRIRLSKKNDDKYTINVRGNHLNKDYLFSYLFTVLLPLYSVSIDNKKEFYAIIFAIVFVVFVLWNLNMHFINIFFALNGYKVFTLPEQNGAILLSTRNTISNDLSKLIAHRLSNSVFIELKQFKYDN
ncbi:MAG TPA: hypothetical protein VK175_16830 [Leadbetterella sp.]|nr:hypothetical protein [Leadbetterella sp.]